MLCCLGIAPDVNMENQKYWQCSPAELWFMLFSLVATGLVYVVLPIISFFLSCTELGSS